MIRSESPTPSGGEAAGAAKFGNAAGGGTGGGGKVYMGFTLTEGAGPGGAAGKVQQPNLVSKPEAYGVIDNFSGKQLRDFIATGQGAGLLDDGAGYMEAQALWKKLVDASARLTAAGRKIAPTDVLAGYLGKGPLAGKVQTGASLWQEQWRSGRKFLVNSQTGEVKYQGPRFETTYQQSIDMTDPATAKALATSVFQQLLHRDPGKGELDGWASALRTAEQQSPLVTQTTTEYDPTTGEPVGTSSTQNGGMSADAKAYMAQQRIKKSKEYGAVQAATTYANALENAVFNNPFGSL